MAGYFLLFYAGVGLIREKRFFGSAPKENPDAIPDRKPERFPGAHILGWTLGVLALALMVGGFMLGGWDGIRSGFGYWAFFARFVDMLYLVELYDIVFFDWILLCNSNFFAHFYPELKGIGGPHQFGYNKKVHALHFALYLPVSVLLAWACTLL